MSRGNPSVRAFAAFTLTELMVAVGVLVVVIVAAAKIFSSASKVSAVAEANADLIQTATAIEQQIRADFANLPKNTFMVIQQVEVNPAGLTQTTVDPSLGSAEIRADQIAFFSRAARTTTSYLGSQQSASVTPPTGGPPFITTWSPESAVARVYYGHGVLAPALPVGVDPTVFQGNNTDGAALVPWVSDLVETRNYLNGAYSSGRITSAKASNWPLVRLATLLGTDGTTANRYGLPQTNASISLFASDRVRLGPLSTSYPSAYAPLWTCGRVDVLKWQTDDIFSQMVYQPNAQQIPSLIPYIALDQSQQALPPWGQASARLRMIQTLANWAVPATSQPSANGSSQLFVSYPRVEKTPPSSSKLDQMLTAPVLAANCSSFKVEWTWADGVGRSLQDGLVGMYVSANATQPWFGLDNTVSDSAYAFANGQAPANFAVGFPLVNNAASGAGSRWSSVEGPSLGLGGRPVWQTGGEQGSKRVYQAVFGFNQDDPTVTNPSAGQRGPYTPLPSAVRITVRLHDALGRIEGGRVFQFIVDLPKR